MIKALYQTLEKMGFVHPLHPALTHIPMGMVMGAFTFIIVFVVLGKKEFLTTAIHCMGLAFLAIFPTVVLGFTDWQYRFYGEWNQLIILKMIFALALAALIFFTIKFTKKYQGSPKALLIIYGLCLALATGLGFMGGQLEYG